MREREVVITADGVDGPTYISSDGTVEHVLVTGPPPPLTGDITFEVTQGGFEIWFSDRISEGYQDLVDDSADWLEGEIGVLNLGQIDYQALMADGLLTVEIRDGLIAWWTARLPMGTHG
jgi:hypothetical protein